MSETTEHPTLAEFLLARIADDEQVARAVEADVWEESRDEYWTSEWSQPAGDDAWPSVEAHFRRFRPSRVLAECEAKRRIVSSFAASSEPLTARTAEMAVVRMVLKLLAVPYADHPDYRDEWRL